MRDQIYLIDNAAWFMQQLLSRKMAGTRAIFMQTSDQSSLAFCFEIDVLDHSLWIVAHSLQISQLAGQVHGVLYLLESDDPKQ